MHVEAPVERYSINAPMFRDIPFLLTTLYYNSCHRKDYEACPIILARIMVEQLQHELMWEKPLGN